jgi:hypothetical protein
MSCKPSRNAPQSPENEVKTVARQAPVCQAAWSGFRELRAVAGGRSREMDWDVSVAAVSAK